MSSNRSGSANHFSLPSGSSSGDSSGQMIDYYKVLPSYFLFKQIEQFVNRVDIRSVFDPADLTMLSHTVDCFKRMNYQLSAQMESKLFQATFICLLSRFFNRQDEDTLNEIVLLMFDSNADRLIPNHVLTLFRGLICRRISSFIAEKKAIKYAEEFMDLLNAQVIEFENEWQKSPDDETLYNDQAFYKDLKDTIDEHVEIQNFHLFAEVLKHADLLLENDDEAEFLRKLAQYKRKSIQQETLLTEITINSSKLTRCSRSNQDFDDEFLLAAGRHFLERTNAFTEWNNRENQRRSESFLRTPNISRKSKAVEPDFAEEDLPALEVAEKSASSKPSRPMSSQQALAQLDEHVNNFDQDDQEEEAPVRKSPTKSRPADKELATKSKKKLYSDDNPFLHSKNSSIDEEDELDFDQSPAKALLSKKKPHVKIDQLCKPRGTAREEASDAFSIPDVDFDENEEEENRSPRATTSKEAMKSQNHLDKTKSKITIERSTPLKFVVNSKKTPAEQMSERRPIPTDLTPVSKTKGASRLNIDSSDSEEDDKENRSASKKSTKQPKSNKQADDESDEENEVSNVASFSKSPKKLGDKRNKVRRKWSDTETTYLMVGIITYGVGNWSRILKEWGNRFSKDRSGMDLRDKYRNLEKQNNLNRFTKMAKVLIEKEAAKKRDE